MFYIVENEEQLSRLESTGKGGCYLDIVLTNDNFHPKLTELVALYIRPLVGTDTVEEKGYIIPISHDEGLNVSLERAEQLLKSFSKIYLLDKKAALYLFRFGGNVCDLALKYSMLHFQKLEPTIKNGTYNWFYNRYGGLANLNRIIPLPKIYEKCEEVFEQVKGVIEEPVPAGFQFYNEYATKVYFLVEQAGIRVDTHEFIERFKPTNPDFSIKGETVFTSYNLYNSTSRPTNSFNGVNFLAIPKGEEYRRLFKPRNSKFVEMDFDGYHIRLVARLLGYHLDNKQKAHKQLARLYLGKNEFSQEEYARAKSSNFQMIYGTPTDECKHLEISEKIQSFIKRFWEEFEKGEARNPESGKLFTHELPDMYPNKLFNYLIQSLETSRNIQILYKIERWLAEHGCKSKIVLVTYDSFLIDWDESEEEVLENIRTIMEQESGDTVFPVGTKTSTNLCFS